MSIHSHKTLRLILGDQLNSNHSWYKKVDDRYTYVLMEIKSETNYAKHHIQKVLAFFSAMRHFAEELKNKGHQVIYIHLNDNDNLHHFTDNCISLITKFNYSKFEYQLPDEYRVEVMLKSIQDKIGIPVQVYDTEHFYTSRNELSEFFSGKKTLLMESFYRYMRKKHKILIDEDSQPLQGKWNFDEENRKKLPKNHQVIEPLLFSNDVSQIESELSTGGVKTIGNVNSKKFPWPINRMQSLELLDFFVQHCLSLFGTYQDAMAPKEWSLYHSRLSFSLNSKLLSPKEVVNKAIETYFQNNSRITFSQLEGFVRQLLGWREYMRGVYWMKMPEYATLNYFNHQLPLPKWFWTGETKMNCLKNAITQSLNYSYAHHIQRLMVTGNFALLAGVHPDKVDEWYLGIYIDAIQWVEITNTRGMSQFADGGIVGTKPYVSSAAYINKMSHYCTECYYDCKTKTSPKACPFNSLYWDFFHRHHSLLHSNPRLGMMYTIWKKMTSENQKEILQQAKTYLKNINEL